MVSPGCYRGGLNGPAHLLYDVFDAESLTRYQYFQEHSREDFDMVLDTAVKIGRDILQPCLREMGQDPPKLVNGQVIVHPVVKTFMRECGEGGWIGAHAPFDRQGQQLPTMIINAFMFIFGAANYSASVYPHQLDCGLGSFRRKSL